MNRNRVVEIAKTAGGKSWREWLSEGLLKKVSGISDMSISNEISLVLADETYQYSIANKAEPVLSNFIEQIGTKGVTGAVLKIGEAINAAEQGTASATFNPWFKHIKAWRNTDPVQLPLRFDFKMGQYGLWDARQEVALPILALLLPSLPKSVSSAEMTGPFQSAVSLLSLILKGTVLGTVKSMDKSMSDIISESVMSEVNKATYRVSLGKQLVLDKAYCIDASVNLSTAVDQNGLPISGSIQLRFEGAVPPALSNSVASDSIRFFGVK